MIPQALGLSPDEVNSALAAAGHAPSLHNSQPWRFRLTEEVIELYQDSDRALGAADPDGRELRLACGAALFNLRLALHGCEIQPIVTLLPDRERPQLLAAVRRGGWKLSTPEQDRLLRAIPSRHTNRRPFSATSVAASEQHALRRAALREGAALHVVDQIEQRGRLRAMAAQAHAEQMADPAFRAELEAWTAVSAERTDGVPAYAGGPLREPQDTWVLRDFTAGTGPTRVPGGDFEEDPLIAVLIPHLSGAYGDLEAGQALQRILLTATSMGVACSFVSQLIEVDHVREELRRMIGAAGSPSAVLRLGYGWPILRTERRPVHDLLVPEPHRAQS
jgi:nitroreductase